MTDVNRINPNPEGKELGLQVLVVEEDNSVYVKFTGFDDIEDADEYAGYLTEVLPLLLFESGTQH
jgi:hypothetical protein